MDLRPGRLLSFLWPIRVLSTSGNAGPLGLTWVNGELVMHTATADQSYGSLHRVWRGIFTDIGLAQRPPLNVLVLGAGAGSIPSILRKELELTCAITAVDSDPVVLGIARSYFGMDRMKGLDLVEQDALAFLSGTSATYDLVCVDLFLGSDLAPGIEKSTFIRELKRVAGDKGAVLFNTIAYDPASTARSGQVARELRLWFGQVDAHRYEGTNLVYNAR